MACPSDPEVQRPKNFVEAISGDNTWDTYGIRIKWTDPVVPGSNTIPINEAVPLKLCVEVKRSFEIVPDSLSAWCWTHIRAEDNKCGIWREIRLEFNPKCSQKDIHGNTTHVFVSSVVPTSDDLYRLTFNVKYKKVMIWANYFQVDNLVDVQVNPPTAIQHDSKSTPAAWKVALTNMMPQAISVYANYFSSLFTKDKSSQQSSSAHGSREGKSGKKKPACKDDEVEMLVML